MTQQLIGIFSLLGFLTLSACGSRLTPTLAQVSGRNVEVVEGGAGSATVVFEAGLGSDWTTWDQVASEVGVHARVFAYSRPGYGRSDRTSEPRNAARIVEELRSLLSARGLAPPYILVGHSFGGTYMELFAKAHPEEVVAVVLVDPRHRDFDTACQNAGFEGYGIPAALVPMMPPEQRAEIAAFADTSDEIRAAGRFGTYPVRVLTGTEHRFSPEVEALWESMLGTLASEAEGGELVTFRGASHQLHRERAHEVAQLILSFVP